MLSDFRVVSIKVSCANILKVVSLVLETAPGQFDYGCPLFVDEIPSRNRPWKLKTRLDNLKSIQNIYEVCIILLSHSIQSKLIIAINALLALYFLGHIYWSHQKLWFFSSWREWTMYVILYGIIDITSIKEELKFLPLHCCRLTRK